MSDASQLKRKDGVMGDLDDRDIKNLTRQFPMEDGKRPCWAVGGGGAAKYLLRAETVKSISGQQIRTLWPSYDDGRPHKDLDVVVFRPDRSGKIRLEFPHEIYRSAFYGPLQRCAYRKNDAELSGFFVEFLTGWYFGFPPPTEADAVHTESAGFRAWTLSPEYLIASLTFHAKPPRVQDDEVIQRLRQRFPIDWERVVALAKSSQFGFLSEMQLLDHVMHGKRGAPHHWITEHVTKRLPTLTASVEPRFHRAMLVLPDSADSDEGRRILREVTDRLSELRVPVDAFSIACQFFTSLQWMRDSLLTARVDEAARRRIEKQLVHRMGTTPYVNVYTSAIVATAARIRLLPSSHAETVATDLLCRMSGYRKRSTA